MGVEALIDIFLESAAILSDLDLEQAEQTPLGRREALRTYSYRVSAASSIAEAMRHSSESPMMAIDTEIDSAQVMCDLPFISMHDDIFESHLEMALLARSIAKDFFEYA
jgi:hypothetical protein